MQIAGKSLQLRESIVVRLKGKDSPVDIQLGCLPLGFPVALERILPEPVPPRTGKCVKDERGDPVLFGGKPVPEVDWSNPDYRRAKAEHDTLVSVLMLYTSMKAAMPELEFDAEKAFSDESLRDKRFVIAIEREFAQSGFSMDVIRYLLGKLREINALDGVVEASESFLSQPAAGETPPSRNSKSEPGASASPAQPSTGTGEPASGSL